MTKMFYAQQLQDLLYPDPTVDAKMDEHAALAAISQARDEVIRNAIVQNKNETNFIPYRWLSEFSGDKAVEIKKDKFGKYYSDLPTNYLTIPFDYNDTGVYHVWLQGYEENLLIPVSGAFAAMYRNQPSRTLEGEMAYRVSGKKIFYMQEMDLECKVEMRLLSASFDLDEYEDFPCDDSYISSILERAISIYQIQKGLPQDKNNNQVSE